MIPPSSKSTPAWRTTFAAVIDDISNVSDHPVRIALRTYSLCFSLSLGPVLLPVIVASVVRPERFRSRAGAFWRALFRELRPTGFALAITIAVGGGATLQRCWDLLERRHTRHWPWAHYISRWLGPRLRTFLANVVTSTLAVVLLRWKRHRQFGMPPPTLDLSLLLLVRALDASLQAFLIQKSREKAMRRVHAHSHSSAARASFLPLDSSVLDKQTEGLAEEWKNKVATHLDALFFWAGSARIMWCFFYQPQRLPRSYVKWINTLANVDKRLLEVLRAIREGKWTYVQGSSTMCDTVGPLAEELGRPRSWVDPAVLPAYGGNFADEAWKRLGVDGRNGIGGLPCELVHGDIGARFGLSNSCLANAAIRAVYAFAEALVIYLPVHFLPICLTGSRSIMRPRHALLALLAAIRSATFLSTFLSSCWFGVCFTRTLVLARLLPHISHDVWDGPFGGAFTGSLICGASIWIENARRRGEMALYVLPKALRASISEKWLRSGHSVIRFTECLTFILSLASLLTFAVHQPESLRGLSKWTLAFVMKGPDTDSGKSAGEKLLQTLQHSRTHQFPQPVI